jgi:hypothetical protein
VESAENPIQTTDLINVLPPYPNKLPRRPWFAMTVLPPNADIDRRFRMSAKRQKQTLIAAAARSIECRGHHRVRFLARTGKYF